jgi:hypothetical protein
MPDKRRGSSGNHLDENGVLEAIFMTVRTWESKCLFMLFSYPQILNFELLYF